MSRVYRERTQLSVGPRKSSRATLLSTRVEALGLLSLAAGTGGTSLFVIVPVARAWFDMVEDLAECERSDRFDSIGR